MFNAHIKPQRILRNNYKEVADVIKNNDYVIITNRGEIESAIIPACQVEKYQEFLHEQYIIEKLNEAEALEDNPNNWSSFDDVMAKLTKKVEQHGKA